jgi:hypothetical protein
MAVPEPSIRYSPYSVLLAVISRAARMDSYRVLSIAAVVNTTLLFVSLYALLSSYRRQTVGFWVLAPMLFLYGTAPGYANSLALEDLPVHQVNPSAFSLWLCLLAWAGWRRVDMRAGKILVAVPACGSLIGCAMLSHGMTGVLGGLGLFAVSAARQGRVRLYLLATTVVTLALAAGLCALWPWYSFLEAIRSSPDPWFWYNPYILRPMLFVWCLPCCIAAMAAVPYRRDEIVRMCLWGLGACLCLGVGAIAVRSATFARLPLAGLIFAQILSGYALWRWNRMGIRALRETVESLGSLDPTVFGTGALRTLLPAAIVYFAVPQISNVLREPHLLRPWLAGALGMDSKQTHPLELYRAVLASVHETDVVMGDPLTVWPVGSIHGRVVAPFHLEFFVPGQQERLEIVQEFLAPQTSADRRRAILGRYDVRWLLLDRDRNSEVLAQLLRQECVVAAQARLVLLDAHCWTETSPVMQGARGSE